MRYSIAIAFVAVAFTAMSARAEVCEEYCDQYVEGNCVHYWHHCTETTTDQTPAASYGAIAYGRNSLAWGTSEHWGTRAKAESAALGVCGQHGKDCEIIVWFKNQCGAVTAAGRPTAYWALGDSAEAARSNALSNCAKQGGVNCVVQAAECSK